MMADTRFRVIPKPGVTALHHRKPRVSYAADDPTKFQKLKIYIFSENVHLLVVVRSYLYSMWV